MQLITKEIFLANTKWKQAWYNLVQSIGKRLWMTMNYLKHGHSFSVDYRKEYKPLADKHLKKKNNWPLQIQQKIYHEGVVSFLLAAIININIKHQPKQKILV